MGDILRDGQLPLCWKKEEPMRTIIALVVIIYLVGVGVVLAPTVSGKWNSGTASELSASVSQALPAALAWPATAYRRMIAAPAPAPMPAPAPTPTKE
jgi:hypothetical protein